MDRLQQQMQFILEVDKLKKIMRQTYLADGSRKEEDADHSWHLALMCALLFEHAKEPIDVLKTIKMVLIHDIVEIDAGDTYAYDKSGNETKREREERAADRIFNLLPQDQAQEMRDLWEEFEACQTADARFAAAMDRIQPLLGNYWTNGKVWKENHIDYSQVYARNAVTRKIVPELWEQVDAFLQDAVQKGMLTDRERRVSQSD